MLEGGYQINKVKSSSVGGGNEDVSLDNGNIVFSPIDPIHIDANGDVFYDSENKNARMYMSEDIVYVERVV